MTDTSDAAGSEGVPAAGMTPDEFRRHGHALIEWVARYWEEVGDLPITPDVAPGELRALLDASAPEDPQPFRDVVADLDRVVRPGLVHWQSPRWFAYFPANASFPSILAELVAAGLGQQGMLWATSPITTELEMHVLDWLVELLGLPAGFSSSGPGGGVLQMSASDSTHTALVVARERADVPPDRCVAYASTQAHSSIVKGARVAGYGHVRSLDVDGEFALRPDALQAAVAADRAAGLHPTFVCASVGTTGTTAVDPVRVVGEVAAAQGLWLHVDAAYAGAAMLCEEFRHHQDGLDLADSYTWNPHKWLGVNFDCSVLHVADRAPLLEAMSILPPYLRDAAGTGGADVDYRDWHVPLGRRLRALKLWFVLRTYGAARLRELLREHVRLARELARWVADDPRFALVAPVPFALVVLRHVAGDAATRTLVEDLNATRRVHVTPTVVSGPSTGGRDVVALRVSVGQTTTASEHVEELLALLDAHAPPV